MSRLRGPRLTLAPGFTAPHSPCCAQSCEGPTLQLRGRNGGVPGLAPPRGARPYMGKLCPADWGSRSCFRPRSRTFLRTGWWAARDRGTQGQARCVCPPLPRVCTPATSWLGDLGKQLRGCEPPFLCRWDVKAGGGGGLPAWLLVAAPGWRLRGWGVGEPALVAAACGPLAPPGEASPQLLSTQWAALVWDRGKNCRRITSCAGGRV